MRHVLLAPADGDATVTLTTASLALCIATGKHVPSGDPVVKLHLPDADFDIAGTGTLALSVTGVEQVAHHLEQAERDATREIGDRLHHVAEVPGEHRNQTCLACGNSIAPSSPQLAYADGVQSLEWDGLVHHDCLPAFLDALDDIWNHSDDLLSHGI